MSTVESFYDQLSEQYHLIATDWDEAIRKQGETLHQILQRYVSKSPLEVLDCSCGIGTQALGLAMKGHQVFASDLSSKAVDRARTEAHKRGLQMQFDVADFRELGSQIPGEFDAIISCDNSIPHLLSEKDLDTAFENIRAKLRREGALLISIRDYDAIQKERPTGMPPRKINDEHGTRIYMQTWDWNEIGNAYELELFLMQKKPSGWETQSYTTHYRAWQRAEISAALHKSGFRNTRWLMPNESNYYQPLIIAF